MNNSTSEDLHKQLQEAQGQIQALTLVVTCLLGVSPNKEGLATTAKRVAAAVKAEQSWPVGTALDKAFDQRLAAILG